MPGFLSQAVSGQAPEARTPTLPNPTPWPPLEEHDLPPIRGEVYLLEGCVMQVLYPDVHEATRRLLRRIGFAVRESNAGCCGALHAHAGHLDEAETKAQALAQSFPDDLPIIVNSAGCGSTMKEYGHVVGEGLQETAKRTYDITEFLLANGLKECLLSSPGFPNLTLTYHDACHLAHGQKITSPPRELLDAIPGVTLTPLPESDLCCGSAGTYNIFQPQMARKLLDRKWGNIADTDAHIVVMGNPGCQGWIQQAADEAGSPIRVLHTADVLEAAFSGIRAR
ncbi:MAG: (Fe-S)-binding protein [Fimbriimonadaceae bacterium]